MISVTEAQVREYCALLGTDPDEQVPDPSNRTMAYVTCPRWRAEAAELLRAYAALEVLRPISGADR